MKMKKYEYYNNEGELDLVIDGSTREEMLENGFSLALPKGEGKVKETSYPNRQKVHDYVLDYLVGFAAHFASHAKTNNYQKEFEFLLEKVTSWSILVDVYPDTKDWDFAISRLYAVFQNRPQLLDFLVQMVETLDIIDMEGKDRKEVLDLYLGQNLC